MKHVFFAMIVISPLISCNKDNNLAEQIAAEGIYDSANPLDRLWLREKDAETIRLQSDKIVSIPISQNLWNINKKTWETLNLDARGIIYLYVSKMKNGKFVSSCALESYLSMDTVMANQLSIAGSKVEDTLDLKEASTLRLSLIPPSDTKNPTAKELIRVCQQAYSQEMYDKIKKYYQNFLTSAWLEAQPTYCKNDQSCEAWRNGFPANWGPGAPVCTPGRTSPLLRCELQAEYGQSCPLYLTQKGPSTTPDGFSSLLISSNRTLQISCLKPGYSCTANSKPVNGLVATSCRPELEMPAAVVRN